MCFVDLVAMRTLFYYNFILRYLTTYPSHIPLDFVFSLTTYTCFILKDSFFVLIMNIPRFSF